MRLFRKFLSLILVLCILSVPIRVSADQSDSADYIQRMIQYYLTYQEQAEDEIGALLDYLSRTDPEQAELWRRIMVSWAYCNSRMTVNQGILPDGLPQDDSLCIVIMGYGLNSDGSMKEELIDRLVVGLSSALKYPNAYVAVTGGATSDVKGITEAGQMAQWLMDRGIGEDRLILETKAYSTLQNAQKVMRILGSGYPQIRELAVVSSDYHIRQSCVFFATAAHCASSAGGVKVTACAVNATGRTKNDLYTQAWGICQLTGIPFDGTPETQPALSE